jgi:hypothetical protein
VAKCPVEALPRGARPGDFQRCGGGLLRRQPCVELPLAGSGVVRVASNFLP